MASKRRKAPADAPSTFKAPGWAKERRDAEKALQARADALAGEVTVRKIETEPNPDSWEWLGTDR